MSFVTLYYTDIRPKRKLRKPLKLPKFRRESIGFCFGLMASASVACHQQERQPSKLTLNSRSWAGRLDARVSPLVGCNNTPYTHSIAAPIGL